MARIFISYRRNDSAAETRSISDRLRRRFGFCEVFVDVDHIRPGLNFVRATKEALLDCETFISIIGPAWLGSTDAGDSHRLDDVHDWVRIEIELALSKQLVFIPVLVGGAVLPNLTALPASLAPMLDYQCYSIRHTDFDRDVQRLIEEIELRQAAVFPQPRPILPRAIHDGIKNHVAALNQITDQLERIGQFDFAHARFLELRTAIVALLQRGGLATEAEQIAEISAPPVIQYISARVKYEIQACRRVLLEIVD